MVQWCRNKICKTCDKFKEKSRVLRIERMRADEFLLRLGFILDTRTAGKHFSCAPCAHWLSWSGGGKQGQMRHGGPVLKKARERGPEIGGPRLLTHAAPARFVRCTHMTQVVHGARKRTRQTTRHQSTSSLPSKSERVALDRPTIALD